MNNRLNQQPLMNYETFKKSLQEGIQGYVDRQLNFTETEASKVNETLDGMVLRLEGANVAPHIYPQKLYATYQAGMPLSMIADSVADLVKNTHEYPEIPDLTPKQAQKHIRFSLINKAWNQKLLQTCPYKEILDLAAVPRWYEQNSTFLVDNGITQMLGITADEVLNIAKRNTESEHYVCKDLSSVIREAMLADRVDAELLDDLYPVGKSPLYVLTNQTGIDGSCAILSDQFLQEAAQQLGVKELCLLPSSRHEMLAVNIAAIDITHLRDTVMSVNCDPHAVQPNDVLSNSVYCYNAKTHLLSILQ